MVSNDTPLPASSYILTKTHCGGWFFNSPPEFYIGETLELFEEHCVTGTKMILISQYDDDDDDNNNDDELIKDVVQYELHAVHKSVHLIRNPFDNLVSRFHHEYTNAYYKKHNKIQH